MVTLADSEQCTGCMACEQSCPRQCIKKTKDKLGNIYPRIDYRSCIECGKCMDSCPELQKHRISFQPCRKAYAVWSLDASSRSSSASGGAATEFYKVALAGNYWICGVEYLNDFHVVHTLSKQLSSVQNYRQSKYVYSECEEIYGAVQQKLKKNEKVLFISLPCKVAGLLSFLGKAYDNLLTVDIVCHGTPPHQQLAEHIKSIDPMKRAKKLRFRFENEFVFRLSSDEDGIIYHNAGRQDMYLAAFLEGLNYRPACYSCSYAQAKRIADLTICDFWGLGTEIPFPYPYIGAVSAVMIHSDHGADFFEECRPYLFAEERPSWEVIKGNAQLKYPSPKHPYREEFENMYIEYGFEKAVKRVLKTEIMKDKTLLRKRMMRQRLKRAAGIILEKYRG